MKATLEYDLNDYDERREHMIALKGRDMLSALYHFMEDFLRDQIRKKDNTEDALSAYENAQKILLDLLSEEGISIDQLYQ